ncbi:uncharacterized protein LOC143305536, partial [Osmia lignaria lignaria]|uniref:uncharacterized protein LOC143305536 n=1 Tax=Osmia lignaria lignaria TaxID=1437193 RepID=UPI00402BD769
MILMLPRNLEDDQAINVNIQRNLLQKSLHLEEYVQKWTVRAWLRYLMNKPLYKLYDVRFNESFFATDVPAIEMSEPVDCAQRKQRDVEETPIERISLKQVSDIDVLIAQQRTMLWSEEKYLALVSGQLKIPPNTLFDKHAEELSFPSIYLGEARSFKDRVKVTPFMMAKSEIRRRDCRGATPDHVLYMALKIMRIRMQGMRHLFRNVAGMSNMTRKMIEDKQYLERTVKCDMSFLRTVPNSALYWSQRKRDVFAMLRQLGRPTMFLTLSASEVRWPHLLRLLYKTKHGREYDADPMKMDSLSRAELVNDDPVTSVLYFDKLVDMLISILKHKEGAFGKYRVRDYFKRIKFQHRGSPYAHILLWLENDPCEKVNEEMPDTLAMVEKLCSVDHAALENPSNQLHKHRFTCFKESAKKCRFGAPFWPMSETQFLIPMCHEDKHRADLKERYDQIHFSLEHAEYKTMNVFFEDNEIKDGHEYLRILRAGIDRPILLYKRTLEQKWTNVYNPWIASVLNSNMDLQFILEEYACAAHVVEYVNKTNRGISNLYRELLKLRHEYPEKDYTDLLKEVGLQVLNSVEMSSQEAAWYLLGLGMSRSSRDIKYIPTVWPEERTKTKRTRKQLEEENVADDDMNIWHECLIEKYENRPEELEQLTLAQFVAYYTPGTSKRREFARIIRYRGYAIKDLLNFKREKVLLHYPFRNEIVDILDCNKFLQLYQDHERVIFERDKEFDLDLDVNEVMRRCAEMYEDYEGEERTDERAQAFVENKRVEGGDADFPNAAANDDDIKTIHTTKLRGIIKKRENVMSEEEYYRSMRCTNKEQRTLILESIYRYINNSSEPIQIFFTGPAGCGKTFTTKLLMETYNRIAGKKVSIYNAYIACALTGKAATAIGGVTVQSAFKIFKAQYGGLQPDQLTSFRLSLRGVAAILIDE